MHAVLLGVVRQMWELFTASTNHSKPYYIGQKLKDVEQRMLRIRVPSVFSRYPGKIEDIKKNKASAWENMLFHYFYPCMVGVLPQKYLKNFMLLSDCIFQLLDINLTQTRIDEVEKQVNRFVRDFQKLFGEENMLFNIHLLTHLTECARNFGALWNSSLYPYENGNGMILGFRTGNNHPVIQITNKYIFNRICQNKSLFVNTKLKAWHNYLWHTKPTIQPKFDQRIRFELQDNLIIDEGISESEFSYHAKFTFENVQYCTRKACEKLGYDDSFIKIDGQFFRIENILTDKNDKIYIVALKLITSTINFNTYSYVESGQSYLKEVKKDIRICVSTGTQTCNSTTNYISVCKPNTQVN